MDGFEDLFSLSSRASGVVLVVAGVLGFSFFIYAAIVVKALPRTGNAFLDLVAEDSYYCLLIPLTPFVAVVAAYLNWVSLKFFRHVGHRGAHVSLATRNSRLLPFSSPPPLLQN